MEGQQLSVDLKKLTPLDSKRPKLFCWTLLRSCALKPQYHHHHHHISVRARWCGICPPPGVFCNFFPTCIYNDTQFWILFQVEMDGVRALMPDTETTQRDTGHIKSKMCMDTGVLWTAGPPCSSARVATESVLTTPWVRGVAVLGARQLPVMKPPGQIHVEPAWRSSVTLRLLAGAGGGLASHLVTPGRRRSRQSRATVE